jgi:hypothetical protein
MIRNPYAADLFIYRNKQALGGASVNKTTLVYNQTGYYEIFARIPTGYTIPDST